MNNDIDDDLFVAMSVGINSSGIAWSIIMHSVKMWTVCAWVSLFNKMREGGGFIKRPWKFNAQFSSQYLDAIHACVNGFRHLHALCIHVKLRFKMTQWKIKCSSTHIKPKFHLKCDVHALYYCTRTKKMVTVGTALFRLVYLSRNRCIGLATTFFSSPNHLYIFDAIEPHCKPMETEDISGRK